MFGFQLIVMTVILNWEDLTNGPFGIRGVPRPSFGSGPIQSGWPIALFTMAVVAIVLWIVWRMVSAPLKLTLHAIRDDETVAQALGIDVVRMRIVIFAMAGGLAAIIGALAAFYFRFVDVSSFTISTMILLWAMVFVGGSKTIVGAMGTSVAVPISVIVDVGVCGSLLVIVIVPELLPAIVGEYVRFRVVLAPGTIVLGVVMPETAKGPALTLIMEIIRSEPPRLLTVAVPRPVLPTVTVPKTRLVGFTLICCGADVAVPESATCSEETPASVVTVSIPVTLPEAFGTNDT